MVRWEVVGEVATNEQLLESEQSQEIIVAKHDEKYVYLILKI